MVDVVQLATDIAQTNAFLLLPAVLWLCLFLVAWEHPGLARRTGFSRSTFWLLLPGAILGTLSDLPFFAWHGAILAVNIGGGLIPVVLSILLFRKAFGTVAPATVLLLVSLVAEMGGLFVAVLLLPTGWLLDVVLLATAAAVPAVLAVAGSRNPTLFGVTLRRLAAFLAIVSGVVLAAFASTSTLPKLGIVSSFPYYLLGPVAAGAIAVASARRVFELPASMGIPIAYAATTLGVLFGADLLRQPPLYDGTPALFAIGGAGVFDLVYLSGLISFVAALAAYRIHGPDSPPGTSGPASVRPPAAVLRLALQLGLSGQPRECMMAAQEATHAAARQSARLRGLPPPPLDSAAPWTGLPVASWVSADQKNLDAVVRTGSQDPREAFRAWVTARSLVGVGRDLDRDRFAPIGGRVFAFLVDLAVLVIPSAIAWVYVAKTASGSASDALMSPLFNAVALALPAYGFVYFAIGEGFWGTSIGKRLFALRVTDRGLRLPPSVSILVRNLPKLIPLSVIGIGGSLLTLALVRGLTGVVTGGSGIAASVELALVAGFVAAGVGLSGVVSALAIHASSERQRAGDLFAGTWVVRAAPTSGAMAPSSGVAAAVPSG